MAGRKGYGRPRTHYRGPDGVQCTSCKRVRPHDAYTAGNPRTCRDCKRFHHLRRKYGLTRESYDAMMVKQNGLCAICVRRDPKYVDHDHATGKVRGLLCQPCNTALGAFYEAAEIFARAVTYLAGSKE